MLQFEKVLVQYGERRKVFILNEALPFTVKTEFEINNEATLVFQEYDDKWGEYLDIKEADLRSVKEKAKIRVVLKEVQSLFRG